MSNCSKNIRSMIKENYVDTKLVLQVAQKKFASHRHLPKICLQNNDQCKYETVIS